MAGVEIELQDGETIEQALLRLANGVEKPAKKKPEPKITVSDPSAGEDIDVDVYAAVHVYQRLNEPEAVVRSNGTRERKMHGPGTLVFVHMHSFGAACSPACKERVTK